jgi:hypothetical protein
LRRAFIVYLISHDRPIAEVLAPGRKDLASEFARGFAGMTAEPVTLDELLAVRETLVALITDAMPTPHKEFLLGFKRGEPDWNLLGVPGASDLPAVRWKQLNLAKLSTNVRAKLEARLTDVLYPPK